ncbi:MAG: hypothetical protein ACOY3P_10835 [Planctomycetota bacterium]
MGKLMFLFTSLLPTLFLPCIVYGEEIPRPDLAKLEVFNEGFPRTLLFRSNNYERWHRSGTLDDLLGRFNGNTTKYAGEEGRYSPELPKIMAAFKRRHPRELCLVHINGEARTITNPVFHERYFPGHWVYRPGEVLKAGLKADTTTIRVDDVRPFSQRVPLRRGNQTVGEMLPSIILVPVDEQGHRLWYESEYAQVTAADPKQKALTVERGQYFSKARAFPAGRTYIAPMHCEHWAGLEWTLNMSTACPKDRNGETAADICVRELKDWCSPGGPAAHVDGIGFDVIYFLAKFPGWDLDNDGRAEDGIAPDGRRFQLEGVYSFVKRLRAAVGEDFLLTSDGWEPKKQRAVGTFNGLESEGLCAPNDAWRMYARMMNTHTYWNLQNDAKYKYSYITTKMLHPDDQKISAQLYRMGAASACVLGVSYCGVDDAGRKDGLPMIAEMHRGAADQTNWLGQPVGPMVVLPKTAPDLLDGKGQDMASDLVKRLETKRCTLSVDPDGSLMIEGTSQNPYDTMEVTLRGIPIKKGDLSVFFEAMAVDPLQGFERDDRIPRLITLHADGLPKYTDERGRLSMYNDIMAYMGTPGFTPQYGYFRRAGEGRGSIDLTFVFEDQGACKLRYLSLHNAPMAIARDFERGVVLVNASQDPFAFDLTGLIPGLRGATLRRIKADPQTYRTGPEVAEMLSYNDGREEDPAKIEVPPLNGLFLERNVPFSQRP